MSENVEGYETFSNHVIDSIYFSAYLDLETVYFIYQRITIKALKMTHQMELILTIHA